jgi:lipid A 3-O-deacylase
MRSLILLAGFITVSTLSLSAAEEEAKLVLEKPAGSLWNDDERGGFRKGASEATLSGAAGFSLPVFGSTKHHGWALGVVDYGLIVSDVVAKDHWYRGNFEVLGDLFGGFQFHPEHAFIVGAAPMLRYNFATGTRIVPFFGLGAGVVATDIRDGDLSTTFEFNLQCGPGVHLFLSEKIAATIQYRFIHLSNAGIDIPNLGVNSNTFMLGLSCFF